MDKSHAADWASDAPTPAQLKELFAQIDSGRVTKDRVQAFLRGEGSFTFPVVVDYALSLQGMIDAGKYDETNSDVTAEHFPVSGEGRHELTIELFQFNRVIIDVNEVLAEFDKEDYRPATIQELLAFGAQHPDVQRKHPIGALGSVWHGPGGFRGISFLSSRAGWRGWRGLGIYPFDNGWEAKAHFAAVRK